MFGLRAAEPCRVDRALLSGANALARQSHKHPDGWGLAYSAPGELLLLGRGTDPAHASRRFAGLARQVHSPLVLAHVRKASVGGTDLDNTHPFTHRGWAFAHNGTVQGFDQRRGALEKALPRELRRCLSGETDSERLFYLFLARLEGERRGSALERAGRALAWVAAFSRAGDPPGASKRTTANFLATDGQALLGFRLGRELAYATRRPGARTGERLERLLISSEPTHPGEGWRQLRDGHGVGADASLRLYRFALR